MSLQAQLLRAIGGSSDESQRSPLLAVVTDDRPSSRVYVAWLRLFEVVLGVAAQESGRARARVPMAPWCDHDHRRLSLVRADCAALDEVPAAPSGAIAPMLELVEELRLWGQEEPIRLLGVQYAIEGSLRVAPRLYQRLVAQLGAEAVGLGLLSHLAEDGHDRWCSLNAQLDDVVVSSRAQAQIVDAARRCSAHLLGIADGLRPHEGRACAVTQALNRDAGDHATTADPREVMAAVDAGQRTWAAHPYYQARYGLRGRRYTRSDSAWLVLLAEAPEHDRTRQFAWITGLLISRGMPSVLLEAHLVDLHQGLCAAVPERALRYDELAALAGQLRERRLAALPAFDELVAQGPKHEQLGDMGLILLSAVADERRGHSGAVSNVEGWLSKSGRCSAEWVNAARDFVLRAIASPRTGER